MTTVPRKWRARLAWVFWLFERASERWVRGCIARQSAGLNFLDGAMVLAAHRNALGRTPAMVRLLAEAGANLAVREHLVFVVVASRGDESLAEWIYQQCQPSTNALTEAIKWAAYFKRRGMVSLLERLQSAGIAQELSDQTNATAATKPGPRL